MDTNENFSLEDVISYVDSTESAIINTNNELSDPFTDDENQLSEDNENDEEQVGQQSDDNNNIDDNTDDETESGANQASNTQEDEEGNEENSSSEQLKKLYQVLKEADIIKTAEDFEFDGSAEALEKAAKQTQEMYFNAAAESLYNSLPDKFKPALKYILEGGDNIDQYLASHASQDKLNNLDLNDVDNQRYILSTYYKKTTKYSDEKIQRLVDKLEASDALLDESADALSELNEILENERTQMSTKEKEEKEAIIEKQKAFDTSIMDAIKTSNSIQTTRKGKVQSYLFNQVNKNGRTDTDFNHTLVTISNNPQHLVQLADFIMDSYDPETGLNPDRYMARYKSNTVAEFRRKLEDLTEPRTKLSTNPSRTTNNSFS